MMRNVVPGDTVTVTLPWSEVCMHMGVAGGVMGVRVWWMVRSS